MTTSVIFFNFYNITISCFLPFFNWTCYAFEFLTHFHLVAYCVRKFSTFHTLYHVLLISIVKTKAVYWTSFHCFLLLGVRAWRRKSVLFCCLSASCMVISCVFSSEPISINSGSHVPTFFIGVSFCIWLSQDTLFPSILGVFYNLALSVTLLTAFFSWSLYSCVNDFTALLVILNFLQKKRIKIFDVLFLIFVLFVLFILHPFSISQI